MIAGGKIIEGKGGGGNNSDILRYLEEFEQFTPAPSDNSTPAPSDGSAGNSAPSDKLPQPKDHVDRDSRRHSKLLSSSDNSQRRGYGLFDQPLRSVAEEEMLRSMRLDFKPQELAEAKRRQRLTPIVAELEALLTPHTRTGVFSLTTIPADTFEEYMDYLKTHAGINDNMSFITPYRELVDDERFKPLFELLFAWNRPETRLPLITLSEGDPILMRFAGELVHISPQAFVGNHFSTAEGRERLRRAVANFYAYDREASADLCKAIADAARGVVEDWRTDKVFSQISDWNWGNISVSDEESEKAQDAAIEILNKADEVFAAHEKKLARPAEKGEDENFDTAGKLQAQLKGLQILAAADTNWNTEEGSVSRYQEESVRMYILKNTERLIREGEGVDTEKELRQYNAWVQEALHGPMNLHGASFDELLWHKTFGAGLDSFMGDLPSHIRAPFDQLAMFSDKLRHTSEMGDKIYSKSPDVKIADEEQKKAVAGLIDALRQTKADYWYSYRQHRAFSRAGSNARMWAKGEGNITDIKRANNEIDILISKLERAEKPEDLEQVIGKIYNSLQEGGVLHTALLGAEMDGTEQMIGLIQTSLEIVALSLVTSGAGSFARLGVLGGEAKKAAEARNLLRAAAEAAGKGESVLVRGARGAGLGAYSSTAENIIGVASGEVRQGHDTIQSWLIDAAATGLSMAVTAVLRVPKSNHSNILGRLYERYTSEGFRGFLGTYIADAGMEPLEELIDQYVNQVLHGNYSALKWEEVTEIFRICAAGGVSGITQSKIGAIAEFAGKAVRQAVPPAPSSSPDVTPTAQDAHDATAPAASSPPAGARGKTVGEVLSNARELFIAGGLGDARVSLREVQAVNESGADANTKASALGRIGAIAEVAGRTQIEADAKDTGPAGKTELQAEKPAADQVIPAAPIPPRGPIGVNGKIGEPEPVQTPDVRAEEGDAHEIPSPGADVETKSQTLPGTATPGELLSDELDREAGFAEAGIADASGVAGRSLDFSRRYHEAKTNEARVEMLKQEYGMEDIEVEVNVVRPLFGGGVGHGSAEKIGDGHYRITIYEDGRSNDYLLFHEFQHIRQDRGGVTFLWDQVGGEVEEYLFQLRNLVQDYLIEVESQNQLGDGHASDAMSLRDADLSGQLMGAGTKNPVSILMLALIAKAVVSRYPASGDSLSSRFIGETVKSKIFDEILTILQTLDSRSPPDAINAAVLRIHSLLTDDKTASIKDGVLTVDEAAVKKFYEEIGKIIRVIQNAIRGGAEPAQIEPEMLRHLLEQVTDTGLRDMLVANHPNPNLISWEAIFEESITLAEFLTMMETVRERLRQILQKDTGEANPKLHSRRRLALEQVEDIIRAVEGSELPAPVISDV